MGTQDLGTGTRTTIAIVAADTLGLPIEAINLYIGDTLYPPSGASGGSTTPGGVSSSTRRAAVDAREELFTKVAPALNTTPDQLECKKGTVRVKGDAGRSLSWKEACSKIGAVPITVHGKNPDKDRLPISPTAASAACRWLTSKWTLETGIVKVKKMVAVQDCGLIIDLKTAESSCYGALIMGISYALFEEKVMDKSTGLMLNPNMQFYRLAGYNDIPELVVHMMTGKGYDERGVIGLGEPPVISPGAAISNAVANAIGVRVPFIPLTPDRVLDGSGSESRCVMRAFEYTSPTSTKQAVSLLGAWENAEVLAGGTDLLALMKDDVVHPKRLVNIKDIKELGGITASAQGLRIGALTTLGGLADNVNVVKDYPALAEAVNEAASPQIRNMATLGGNLCQRPRCWYFRNRLGLLPKDQSGNDLIAGGENRFHAILGNDGPAKFVSPSTIAPVLIAYGAKITPGWSERQARVAAGEIFRHSEERE